MSVIEESRADLDERRKNILIEALQEWHDPKNGRTFTYLSEKADLADSTIRDLAKGRRTPSRETFNTILRLIWTTSRFEEVLDRLEGHRKQYATYRNAAKFSFHIEGPWETWFVVKLGEIEQMPIALVRDVLGSNFDAILAKYVDNGFVTIDGDTIRTSCSNNQVLSVKSIKSIAHYGIDKYDGSKGDTEHLHTRAIRVKKATAIALRNEIAECTKRILEKSNDDPNDADGEDCCFLFVLASTVV